MSGGIVKLVMGVVVSTRLYSISVHRSLPKICQLSIAFLTERNDDIILPVNNYSRSFLSNSLCIYSTVCVPMRCPSGPREDESVSVMRLENKSSIHNLTKCICNASWDMQSIFFSFFFLSFFNSLRSGRLMSLTCSSASTVH